MNVYDFLVALRRRAVIVAVCSVLGAAAMFGYSASRPATYTAQSQMFALVRGAQSPGDLAAGASYMKMQVQSYPQLITSPEVLTKVKDSLGLTMSLPQLTNMITVDVPTDTMWINVSVKDTSASRATDIANTVSTTFVDAAENLESRGESTSKPVIVEIVAPAQKPTQADGSKATTYIGLGLIGGLVLGAFIASFLAIRTARRWTTKS